MSSLNQRNSLAHRLARNFRQQRQEIVSFLQCSSLQGEVILPPDPSLRPTRPVRISDGVDSGFKIYMKPYSPPPTYEEHLKSLMVIPAERYLSYPGRQLSFIFNSLSMQNGLHYPCEQDVLEPFVKEIGDLLPRKLHSGTVDAINQIFKRAEVELKGIDQMEFVELMKKTAFARSKSGWSVRFNISDRVRSTTEESESDDAKFIVTVEGFFKERTYAWNGKLLLSHKWMEKLAKAENLLDTLRSMHSGRFSEIEIEDLEV